MLPGQGLTPDEKMVRAPATTAVRKDLNIMLSGKPNWRADRLRSTMLGSDLCFGIGQRRQKQMSQRAGSVRYTEIWKNKKSKSRGMGTVNVEHPTEAT